MRPVTPGTGIRWMSWSGGSSRRVGGAVSAVGAVRHEAKKAMATSARRPTIAETVFIFSSSEIWLRDFLFRETTLESPNENKSRSHAYLAGITKLSGATCPRRGRRMYFPSPPLPAAQGQSISVLDALLTAAVRRPGLPLLPCHSLERRRNND